MFGDKKGTNDVRENVRFPVYLVVRTTSIQWCCSHWEVERSKCLPIHLDSYGEDLHGWTLSAIIQSHHRCAAAALIIHH